MMNVIELCERALLPDWLTRAGMRRLLGQRLKAEAQRSSNAQQAFRQALRIGPIAVHTDAANAQHYEVPEAFYQLVLGENLKYSCCHWDDNTVSLDQAEASMLALTCDRAALRDGMRVLELGCGWGAVTLWMAEHYPNSSFVAVSNSTSQKRFIDEQAQSRRLNNIEIVTADINDFSSTEQFDRVISVEMFEHVRNYEELMRRVASWLAPEGQLFVHIFCHQAFAYPFEDEGQSDWMSRHFFTGGTMPSESMLLEFQDDLVLEQQWRVSGQHYEKTANAWLQRIDAHADEVRSIFQTAYEIQDADRWIQRWRMFFMACAELFGYDDGREWMVGHYRFSKKGV